MKGGEQWPIPRSGTTRPAADRSQTSDIPESLEFATELRDPGHGLAAPAGISGVKRDSQLGRLVAPWAVVSVLSVFGGVTIALAVIESAPPAFAQKKKKKETVAPDPATSDDPAAASDAGDSGDMPDTIADPEGDGTVDVPADADVGSGDGPMDESGAEVGSGDGPMDEGATPTVGMKLDENPGPPIELAPGAQAIPGVYMLQARLGRDGPPLQNGVTFRVFGDALGADGKLPELAEANGGTATFKLEPGSYLVYAAYGRAGAAKRIKVDGIGPGDTVVLNAGGLKLSALTGKDQRLPPALTKFDIYAPDEAGSDDRSLLVENCPADKVVALNAGIYHVVSRYGDANAVVRADIKVEVGKLTEATLYQKAARLTLKLVDQHGGEAIADTAWTVKTEAGESIVENVGAFPSVVLAAGAYKAVAKHDGRVFEREFTVEPGRDRDIEVIAE